MAGSDAEYADLQTRYIAELDDAMPDVRAWWARLVDAEPAAGRPLLAKRWPTGPAGHPRLIAIYRAYHLAVADLNEANAVAAEEQAPDPTEEQLWAGAVRDPVTFHHKPQALLIEDLADRRRDLHQIMQGLVFIPVGLNHHGDLV